MVKNENNNQYVKSCQKSYLQIFSGQKSGNKSLQMVQDKEKKYRQNKCEPIVTRIGW